MAAVAIVLAAAPDAAAQPGAPPNAQPGEGAPRVVASIKPIHALVAAVMDGVGRPALLVRGAASPHGATLRPSDARALAAAAVVFWVGPAIEGFLERPLNSLAVRARVVTLSRTPGLVLVRRRPGGEGGGDHGDRRKGAVDPHIWLDPGNARRIADHAAAILGDIDPRHAALYEANRRRLASRIDALDGELRAALAPVRTRPYVVFHDAYRYFQRRYRLNAVAAVSPGPERRPGARRLRAVRAAIRTANAVCVFSEPQFPPALVATLIRGTNARAGVLDPLGANLAPGPDAWFALMRGLAGSLRRCLAAGG